MHRAPSFRPGPRLSDCLAASFTDTSLLRVRVERYDAAVMLCLGGEVDASNIDTWRCLLEEVEAATSAPGPLLIDVRHLDFMAVCAFAALACTAERCARRGIALRLISTQRCIARTIAAARWQTWLPIYGDVHTALEDNTAHRCPDAVPDSAPAYTPSWPVLASADATQC